MSTKIDEGLHVQLKCNGCIVSLPLWFVQEQNNKITKFSVLLNFPLYMKNNILQNEYSLLEEFRVKQFYKS